MDEKYYKAILQDHFKNPRNKKTVTGFNFSHMDDVPSCGDKISITGIIEKGVIKDLGFEGSGCVISQASASMLTDKCRGMKIDEVLAMTKDDILSMLGLQLGPNRIKCALLALQVLQKALSEYLKKLESSK